MKARDHPSKIPYGADIALSVEPREVAFSFRRLTCRIWILIDTQANALQVVACLLEMGAEPSWVNKSFLAPEAVQPY